MKRRYPPLWLGCILLFLALVWRMLGAPLTGVEWQGLKTPFWQARVLLPGRLQKVLLQWHTPAETSPREEAGEAAAQPAGEDRILQVWNADTGQMEEMLLEDYVFGVVAAEMPAAYHLEALKAQAVAARTRALQPEGGCDEAPGADVCTRSGHCQGYAAEEELRKKWGNEYELYRQRIREAVHATAGEILTWQGEPILVMYHAISGGRTEDVQAVFSEARPYLVSVESGGEEGARGYREDAFFSYQEAAQLLDKAFPDLSLTPESLRRTLAVAAHTRTGRVESLLLGSGSVKATAFRSALGLRSTLFTFSMDDSGITFHQTGYGHGVGMSQAGANHRAAEGEGYRQILAHYYPQTELEEH